MKTGEKEKNQFGESNTLQLGILETKAFVFGRAEKG